ELDAADRDVAGEAEQARCLGECQPDEEPGAVAVGERRVRAAVELAPPDQLPRREDARPGGGHDDREDGAAGGLAVVGALGVGVGMHGSGHAPDRRAPGWARPERSSAATSPMTIVHGDRSSTPPMSASVVRSSSWRSVVAQRTAATGVAGSSPPDISRAAMV